MLPTPLSKFSICCCISFSSTKDASYNLEDGSVRMYIRGRPVQLFAPSPLVDTYSLSKVSPAPPNKLKLEWVYGKLTSPIPNNSEFWHGNEFLFSKKYRTLARFWLPLLPLWRPCFKSDCWGLAEKGSACVCLANLIYPSSICQK